MDIKHLQYFIEVANYNSFTRAADHLFITQPTISKMIKNLENDLGVELFDRSGKKLSLTDAGRVVYEQALLINKAFNNLETEMDNLLGLKKGHIRIGLPPIIDSTFFPKLIGRFHQKYPNITFQLIEDGSKKIEESVADDSLDIGIIMLPTNPNLFHHVSFIKEDLKLILHPTHPFASKQSVHLADLKDENFIMFNKEYAVRDLIISSCNRAGFNPRIMSESSRWDFIEELVACKMGVALLPESICRQLSNQVQAVEITNPSLNWNLGIIWRKEQYLSYAAKEWLRFMIETISPDSCEVNKL